ncbi:hypothetical protein Sta7437_3884 [Stanieria cyanosphaera PCC 7437]|uniref:Uncharacterized protein n=1 Tax=Stanieria cyanosphaera (strain ATCC 29371 / PCC 7437) TaxID=111780 RepID=K9XXW3_STAC7|nr:hypothetical protein Sta7437_3884 [Stanieria cyanosphaera PCC 7437]
MLEMFVWITIALRHRVGTQKYRKGDRFAAPSET